MPQMVDLLRDGEAFLTSSLRWHFVVASVVVGDYIGFVALSRDGRNVIEKEKHRQQLHR